MIRLDRPAIYELLLYDRFRKGLGTLLVAIGFWT